MLAGWGAAVWEDSEEGLGAGPQLASAHGHLGEHCSNNQAEYIGLRECLKRAVRVQHPRVVFQVDAKLVAQQMAEHNAWTCRSDQLLPLRDECLALGQLLTRANVVWEVRHIFREFNQTADGLANQGVDCMRPMIATSQW